MIPLDKKFFDLDLKKNAKRQDGRNDFESRNISFKFNIIPSSLSSFYIEFGSNKFILALFSSLLKHKKKNFQCYLETIFLDSFAKLKNFIFLEKNSLQISSIVERTILKNLFPNIKFYILIRKIKNDGSFYSQLTWASQILIILSHVPYKIKINFNSLGIIGNRILIDLTSEEMFFTKTYLEIISEEEQECKILMILGSNLENFTITEKALGFIGNNFVKFIFTKINPTNYFYSFL
jgi:ribonuclease PH